MSTLPTETVLGVRFFRGTASEAVEALSVSRGYVAIPASPALINLRHDEDYRVALNNATLVLSDSDLLSALWRIVSGRQLPKISGTVYLKCLLSTLGAESRDELFWILPSQANCGSARDWLLSESWVVAAENFYIPEYGGAPADHYPILIELEKRRPKHIIIALGAGSQEKLASYLKESLLYEPCIHCVGAAVGFLAGYEKPIPNWAERLHIGWLGRFMAQPRMILPRLGMALVLVSMVLRYGSHSPPIRRRWAEI